jgi:vacuolar-type H+-ATPase subunit I/STV1
MTIGDMYRSLYNGKLLIGLYNFSSSSFPLIPGKKLIAAVFSKLSPEEQDRFKKPENPIFDFPDDLIRLMEKYKPISIQVIMDEIKKLNCKIDLLNNEIKDREDWYKRLQEGIEHHEKAIEKLTNLLEKETNERRESQKDIDAKLSQLTERMYDNFNKYSKEAYRIAAIYSVGGAFLYKFNYLVDKEAHI